MRKYHKTQCVDLLSSIEEAHEQVLKFIEKNQINDAVDLLQDCQQGAIQIGTTIDQLEGEGTEAVHILERYCESTYQIYEELLAKKEVNGRQIRKKLRKIVIDAKNEILYKLSTQYEAVFLPYNASMWDSLESIWMAADEDPNCEAYVIPIPYFDRNPDGSFAQIHYEAEAYPDYVPVVGYANFNLEEHHPDMIFIHNPYDNYNYVTSVHPDYYSKKLKDYTDCLVYIPYYATSGKMSEGQSFCSAYLYADYIVVQSKAIIDQFDPQIPKEKFLPLGSPKFDRVIRLCKNPPDPPAEWKDKIEGKRVYFYNTSISGMLENTENFLKKLKYVFDTFREVEDACLLWRPHPLLRSTFESMRSEYLNEYEALVKYFIEEDIGIYDTTTDIEMSIALSDAYIGDAGSSVVSLFEISGKPVYLLNNRLNSEPGEDDWKGEVFKVITSDKEVNRYCLTQGNQLYKDITGKYDYRWFCQLPGELYAYNAAISWKDQVICMPIRTEDVLLIDANDKSVQYIRLKHRCNKGDQAFNGGYLIDDYLFLMPNKYEAFVRIDLNSREICYLEGVGRYYMNEVEKGDAHIEIPSGIAIWRGKFIISKPDGREILLIDQKTLCIEKKSIDVGYFSTLISCQKPDADEMWFIPYEGSIVTVWNVMNNSYERYDLFIDGLESIDRNTHNKCNYLYFAGSVPRSDGKCIFPPVLANKFILLDRNTRTASEWCPSIKIETEDVSQYMINWGMGGFCFNENDNSKRRYNYLPRRKAYDFNPDTGEMTEIPVSFDKEEVKSKVKKGFMEDINGRSYFCWEDIWNPMSAIANNRISGDPFDRSKCLAVCAKWNASPEGDCGKKTYMKILGELK